MLALDPLDLITELGLLGVQTTFNFSWLLVLVGAAFNWDDMALMLLFQSLGIGNGLHGGVVMVDVRLSINGGHHMLVLRPRDCLVVDSRVHFLMDSCVIVTILDPVCCLSP